jgi:hypothetical protein
MPAIPIITTGLGIVNGINQNNQANQQNDLTRQQVELEAQKFNWNKEQTEREYQNRILSANKFWDEYNNTTTPTYEDAYTQAGNQLSPMYDTQMKEGLQNLGNTLKTRGFYGQLPGDVLTQNAAAKSIEAKNAAIGGLANNLYQAGQDRKNNLQQLGMSTFGTYGNTELPKTPDPAISTSATPNTSDILKKLIGSKFAWVGGA